MCRRGLTSERRNAVISRESRTRRRMLDGELNPENVQAPGHVKVKSYANV